MDPVIKLDSWSSRTIESKKSHIKLLASLGYQISNISNDLFKNEIYPRLKDKGISASYITLILSTIRSLNSEFTLTAKQLGLKRSQVTKYPFTPKLTAAIERLIKDSLTFVYENNITSNHTRTIIDSRLAIVLCFITNLRSWEVAQLTLKDLLSIKQGKAVFINTKKQINPNIVTKFGAFFDIMFNKIIDCVKKRNELHYNDIVQLRSKKVDNIITTALSNINITIRNIILSTVSIEDLPQKNFGLQIIRHFNTLKFISQNEFTLAQKFNRHKQLDTTVSCYNNPDVVSDINTLFLK